ncbi:MAG: type I restriction enzyme HsdR N-terminal domain-containing protein [Muribaculaceae bacterium]|nr:type I restriction enzyme HsdR N-terminal domain-containing protein [Muribaculaceae bacterium]
MRDLSRLLNLPPVDLRLKRESDNVKVFDTLRKKYVAVTPEEIVRQHFVSYLINTFHYPASLMQNEVSLSLNGLSRRCDTVIYRPDGRPRVIVEYKAPTVCITQSTFDQIARYNIVLEADYLIVSNGIEHFCCVYDHQKHTYNFIPVIPDYKHLVRTPDSGYFDEN